MTAHENEQKRESHNNLRKGPEPIWRNTILVWFQIWSSVNVTMPTLVP